MLIQGKIKKLESRRLKNEAHDIVVPDYYIFEIYQEQIPKEFQQINFDGLGASPYEAIKDTHDSLIQYGINAVLEVK